MSASRVGCQLANPCRVGSVKDVEGGVFAKSPCCPDQRPPGSTDPIRLGDRLRISVVSKHVGAEERTFHVLEQQPGLPLVPLMRRPTEANTVRSGLEHFVMREHPRPAAGDRFRARSGLQPFVEPPRTPRLRNDRRRPSDAWMVQRSTSWSARARTQRRAPHPT